MLEGEVTVRLGDEKHVMSPGDFIRFPAGQEAGHCLINESNDVCRYLMIGDHDTADVCVYTDSNKFLVRAMSQVFDLGAKLNYWDREDFGEGERG